MKLMKFVGAAIAFGMCVAVVDRQTPAQQQPGAPAGWQAQSDQFWTRWEGGQPSEAIRLAATTPDRQRAWEPLGRAADEFQSRIGSKCLGHSEITRRAIGDHMEYVAYLALYDPSPIRVQVLYYRPKDVWAIVSLRLDVVPERWMTEAARLQLGASEGQAQEEGQAQ